MQISTTEIPPPPLLHTIIHSTNTTATSTGEEFLSESNLSAQNRYVPTTGGGLHNELNFTCSFDIFLPSQDLMSVNKCLSNLVLNTHHREGETSAVSKEITWNTVLAHYEDQLG
jgi:hypothetical protein